MPPQNGPFKHLSGRYNEEFYGGLVEIGRKVIPDPMLTSMTSGGQGKHAPTKWSI